MGSFFNDYVVQTDRWRPLLDRVRNGFETHMGLDLIRHGFELFELGERTVKSTHSSLCLLVFTDSMHKF